MVVNCDQTSTEMIPIIQWMLAENRNWPVDMLTLNDKATSVFSALVRIAHQYGHCFGCCKRNCEAVKCEALKCVVYHPNSFMLARLTDATLLLMFQMDGK